MKFNEDIRPAYWTLLSSDDKEEYTKLRKHLSTPQFKNRRNRSIGVFKDAIEMVRKFVVKGDSDDKNRALVAGIMFFETYQAINIHQLKILLSKSKSCINGLYQAMGYSTIPAGADSAVDLIKLYPFFKNNFAQLRTWTLRQKIQKSESKKAQKKNSMSIENPNLIDTINSLQNSDSVEIESLTIDNEDETIQDMESMMFERINMESMTAQISPKAIDFTAGFPVKANKDLSPMHLDIDDQIFVTPPPDVFDPLPSEVSIGDDGFGSGELRIPDLENPYGYIELSDINQDFNSDDI